MISIHLNLAQKITLYTHGGWPTVVTLFLILGPFFIYLGGGDEAFRGLQFDYKEVVLTEGYITDIVETNAIRNEESVYRLEFSFPVGLETVYGTSFSSNFELDIDDKVYVEYVKSNPDISRIQGTIDSNNAALAFLGLILSLASAIVVPMRLTWLNRMLAVFRDGTITRAEFKNKINTGTRINDRVQFKYTYTYKVGLSNYDASLRTTERVGMNRAVNVIYANRNPKDAVLFPKLPYSIYRLVLDEIRTDDDVE